MEALEELYIIGTLGESKDKDDGKFLRRHGV